MDHLLSLLIFLPLLVAAIILAVPSRFIKAIKLLTLGAAAAVLVLSLMTWFSFNPSQPAYQFVEKADWFGLQLSSFGYFQVQYFLGVDGLSIAMVLLTGIVGVIGVLSSWNLQTKNPKGYFALYLLLLASVMGCFLALDMFLFYLFFEFMLLPMYFLIGIWGGPRREYAAIKFFLYTLVGSLFILIVMIGLYTSVIDPIATAARAGLSANQNATQFLLQTGKLASENLVHTFSIPAMTEAANYIPGSMLHLLSDREIFGYPARLLAFLVLFAGFAIKIPVVPVHTWLPDAHVEAPTPISVMLAAVLLKVGAYGLFRIAFPVFPEAAVYFSSFIAGLGVLSILYGAFCALAMSDLKKLIAYSSVSHMGFVLLGLASFTTEGVSGAIYQLFSHGLISAMLFLVVGVLYDRYHNRQISGFRGLASALPAFTFFVVVAFFASLGLPGLSGFIAELLVLLGAFTSASANGLLSRWFAVLAAFGILLGAAYYLWALQRMFFGKFWIKPELQTGTTPQDLTAREYFMLVPLAILILAFGIFPHLLLDKVSPAAAGFVNTMLSEGKTNLPEMLNLLP
ncbi:NADH-quinone oxidoreductase subunit M [Adhaeribacter sp. BT258]|uniref:NADH-quinone oxidoreductase subunit M n=1 Tax=Adhaeribacter terrigena TaxID=2793070 RepID=A0ABS1C5F7_9BACT|nr:NADH-quinone oxidoreductase subunit M [Adhaeribacter terrigena]MBK0404604.1 NADH-quinone oxidoreductase subunit M [Adhaeribacter terrigena]